MTAHVLHILNSAHGGSAISTFELIEALKKRGTRSSLVCFNNETPEMRERITQLVDGRVLFIPLYWMNKRIRSAIWKRPVIEALSVWRTRRGHRFQPQIRALIQKYGVNLVHTSTILNPEGAIASRLNNIPHIWHVRELIGPDKHYQFYNYNSWSRFVTSHCEFLVANSRVTEQCLQRFFPAEKVRCIPNGIYVERFTPISHEKIGSIVVAMVGSVTTRWKNHEFFIRVAHHFKHYVDIEFRIYGALPAEDDTYYRHLLNLIAALGIENLKLIPFKASTEIMGEIDVMFHPTEFESFGRIFAEAMAAGIPVIAIDEGGALEMIEHDFNGYLVPKNSVPDAALYIGKLAADPALRNELGRNGQNLVKQKYSIEKLTSAMEDLYSLVLKSGSQLAMNNVTSKHL